MALNPASTYPGQTTTPSTQYPYGGAKDVTAPGAQDGTPFQAALINDHFGFQQALLQSAGLVPSNVPETADSSQYLGALNILIGNATGALTSRVVVTTAADFAAVDSTKEYYLNGFIDMTGVTIEVPTGGITINGPGANISGLIATGASDLLFSSAVGGCGPVTITGCQISVTGATSSVFALTGIPLQATLLFDRVLFQSCTSRGYLSEFLQGVENTCGCVSGTPSLEFRGAWPLGYRVTGLLCLGFANTSALALLKQGAGLSFGGRFILDKAYLDVGDTMALSDFAPANFAARPFNMTDSIVSRNGVLDPTDGTLLPNMPPTATQARYQSNEGVNNTFIGGRVKVTAEVATVIPDTATLVEVAGTFAASQLSHFDNPANGQLRHLGATPVEYRATASTLIDGPDGNVIELQIRKWDDSASAFVEVETVTRIISNYTGGRDIATCEVIGYPLLDQNDYVAMFTRNTSTAGNLTAELDGTLIIEER